MKQLSEKSPEILFMVHAPGLKADMPSGTRTALLFSLQRLQQIKKMKFLLLIMATLSLFSLFAAEEGDETASLIFKKAIELQARRDFKAELDIQQKSNKPPLKGVFMQKVNPDGSVYSRTEITGG